MWNSTRKRVNGRNTSERKWSKQELKVSTGHDASLAPVRGERPGREMRKKEPQTA